jgi:hypothetical protein
MGDLTPEQVRSLAAAIGLVITDGDLGDVTLRLNAALEHLARLEALASTCWWPRRARATPRPFRLRLPLQLVQEHRGQHVVAHARGLSVLIQHHQLR